MAKKIIAIVICVAVCLLTMPAIATDEYDLEAIKISDYDGYTISEMADTSGVTVRIMKKLQTVACSTNVTNQSGHIETEKMLLAMGMDGTALENLTEEDWAIYSSAPTIYAAEAYVKTDANGNITYVTEQEAAEAAETFNAVDIAALSGGQTSNTKTDSYMHLYVSAIDLADGNGSYRFVTEAKWLTMPIFRGKDAIGISAQQISVTPNTQSGYFNYDYKKYINGVLDISLPPSKTKTTIASSKFEILSNTSSTFHGMGTIVDIPNDINTSDGVDTSYYYNNYFVHIQFNGHISHPTLKTWFNVIGSYTHTTFRPTFNWSLTINPEKNSLDGSIGFAGLKMGQEIRSVMAEVVYTP